MTIKKIGHCCLLIKIGEVTILTDPGMYSDAQNTLTGIDLVLITHEHGDHLHIESLQEILQHNPEATVITNSGVGKKLDELHIPYTVLEHTDTTTAKGIALQAFDGKHEEIFEEIGQVQNTGYFIADTLFYPGDSFHVPGDKPVPVLALPVAGPWCRIADAIRYGLRVKPKKAFPVHDGMFGRDNLGFLYTILQKVLTERGVDFVPMHAGDEKEF